MRKQRWMTAAIAIIALGWTITAKAQFKTPEPSQAEMTSLNQFGEVLARVNGEPVPATAVFPMFAPDREFPLAVVAPRLKLAVDRELISQEAAGLGLDKNPEYLNQIAAAEFPLAMQSRRLLVRLYMQTIPELNKKVKFENPTAAEIDAYLAENPDKFAQLPVQMRRTMAETRITQAKQDKRGLAGEWLKKRLATVRFTVDGKEIPGALIGEAATAGRTAVLLPAIKDMVVNREVEKRGIDANAIETNTELLTLTLSGSVVEAGGEKVTLGDIPQFERLAADLAASKPMPAIVFKVLSDLVVAADARENGIDEDPGYLEQQRQVDQRLNARRADILGEVYYAQQGMGADAIEVTDAEVEDDYNWYRKQFRIPEPSNKQRLIISIHKRLETKKMESIRGPHLAKLRAGAEIEYLIDMPE